MNGAPLDSYPSDHSNPYEQSRYHGQIQQQAVHQTPFQHRAPIPVSQHPQMDQNQRQRVSQSEQMTQQNFQRDLHRSIHMNDQIMSHRMSNMSSLTPLTTPDPAEEYISFQNEEILSDQVPTSQQRRFQQQQQQHQQQLIQKQQNYYPSQQQYINLRGCDCQPGQSHCGTCQLCGLPGHRRDHPGPTRTRGQWCDPHYEREKREVMKKHPDQFINYQYSQMPAVGPGQRLRQAPSVPQAANKHQTSHNFSTEGQHRTPLMSHAPTPTHHPDREISGNNQHHGQQPRVPIEQNSSPYQLNENNMDNFKGNNPFSLNRTTVRRELLGPREQINYVGFNAQGEKIHDKKYYEMAPGKSDEFDYYRQYQKLNQGGDYQPSNQSSIQDQYRSYQGNIPPKRMKLTPNNLPTPNFSN